MFYHQWTFCIGQIFFICIYKFIYLFIYFWPHWVFVATHGLSLAAAHGGYSSLQCAGLSLRWPLLLWSTGSRRTGFSSCGLKALERRLSSCGTRAQLLRDMWDLPGPGLEPVSPALAGGFSTIVPPGKPLGQIFFVKILHLGTSLAVQWLRLRASTPGGTGSIPGQGTKI